MIYTAIIDSPLGSLRAAAEEYLFGLWIIGQRYEPSNWEGWIDEPDYPVFVSLRAWLGDYFACRRPKWNFPLRPQGTAFQQAVWKLLMKIPYGKSLSYGALTKQLAAEGGTSPKAVRAVGNAVGHNPISILIPCHRVIGADGSLTGYAGGIERKRALLELEQTPNPAAGAVI